MNPDLRTRLIAARARPGPPSSDYDLNTDVKLAEGRALRDAAVLIAIVERGGGASVILTKRASTLKHHPGQIAFPGGKVEADDASVDDAALREAEEEIGLRRDAVEVLGTLPFHETVTSFRVTPVLALVSEFDQAPDASEVAEVFEVPLAHLLAGDHFSVQSRRWRGARRAYFTVPYGPYYIWGATARILRALADRIDGTD